MSGFSMVSESGSRATPLSDRLPRPALEKHQFERLETLLREVLPGNRFYAQKLTRAGVASLRLENLADWKSIPFTTKAELSADQEADPPYGTNRSFPLEQYSRLHQTSGTSGRPLYCLDTPSSWQSCLDIWDRLFQVAGLGRGERFYFAFSFGPFLGFWSAFEAAGRAGCFCLAGGGLSTVARLREILEHRITVIVCTPTYALHLAEAACQQQVKLADSAVRAVLVAGEPGGNIPATRKRIEGVFGARVLDHAGLTEVGPTAIECWEQPGSLHIMETDYIAEIIDPAGHEPVPAGQVGELVLTTLTRVANPLLRYRTGDLVQQSPASCPCGRTFLRLDSGILGRVDDMIHLRGNNLYPSALEAILRRFAGVAEYRVTVDESAPLAELRIEVEPADAGQGGRLAHQVEQAIRDELLFRAEVWEVPAGTLPRFEMKARRVIRKK